MLNQCEVLDSELSENLRAKAVRNQDIQAKLSRAFAKEDYTDSSDDEIDA